MNSYLENVFRHRAIGRPRKPDAMKARTVSIAVSPEQLRNIDDLAKQAGMNRSRFVAACVSLAGPDIHDLEKQFARSRHIRQGLRCSRCGGTGQQPFVTTHELEVDP